MHGEIEDETSVCTTASRLSLPRTTRGGVAAWRAGETAESLLIPAGCCEGCVLLGLCADSDATQA